MDKFSTHLVTAAQTHLDKLLLLIPKIGLVIVILVTSLIFSGKVRSWVRSSLTRFHVEVTLVKFLSNLSRWIFIGLIFFVCLGIFGIKLTGITTIIGGLTIAIGLAFQGTLSNFASGLMLLIFRPYKVGDFVKIADESGTVSELGIFATNLYTIDNRAIILPNSLIFGQKIENITFAQQRRVDIKLGVEYSANIDETRKILEQVMEDSPKVLKGVTGRTNQILLEGLGDSSVNWQIRAWCNTGDYWDVWQNLVQQAKEKLEAGGIEIPFPQVHLHWSKEEQPKLP